MTGFADGLARGELRVQRCSGCGTATLPPRLACPACGAATLPWQPASGGGTVWAVTVVHRAPSDLYKPLLPYTLVLVQLDEGPRVMGHGHAGLAIGDRVLARFFNLPGAAPGQLPLLRFEPDPEPGLSSLRSASSP